MRSPSNATIGARKLGAARTGPSEDARASFRLVGAMTAIAARTAPPVAARPTATTPAAAAPTDPITAARTWLANPERRAALSPSLVSRAEASLLVAERYYRELDRFANELAVDAMSQDVGEWDPAGMERVDGMVDMLVSYSSKLRTLLDLGQPTPDADRRIAAALTASRAGGLPALVAAL